MRAHSAKYLHPPADDPCKPYAKWHAGEVLLDEAVARGPVDLPALFGNRRPVEVEIGTGKGTFLLARAAARPEVNFLGIEWAGAYAAYAADRFRRAGLTNARMIRCDAAHFFKVCLADRSLWRVHVYFPDPWPKQRHHRRRLVQPAFLKEVHRTLRPGGQLIIVTDHQDYFIQIQEVVNQTPGLAEAPTPRLANREGDIVGTNFERKYVAQGRPFYKLVRICYACVMERIQPGEHPTTIRAGRSQGRLDPTPGE